MRKVFVNVLATAVVLLLGGAAVAATSMTAPVEDPTQAPELPVQAVQDPPAVEDGDATADSQVDAAQEDAAHGAGEGFGQVRSQEARRFGACMEETDGDREACEDLKPGPAWQHPDHPGRGPDHENHPGGGPDRADHPGRGEGRGHQDSHGRGHGPEDGRGHGRGHDGDA